MSQAAPQLKAEAASANQAKGVVVRSQDDLKQHQKSPVLARSNGPALVDPSSEKYSLMPESLRRKIARSSPSLSHD